MIAPNKDDVKPLIGWRTEDFKSWLRTGLEGYLFEEKGSWAFEPMTAFVGARDHIVLDLADIYGALPSKEQDSFREAIPAVLGPLGPEMKNFPIFEYLIDLASLIQAHEVLRILPSKVGNGFFGDKLTAEGRATFTAALSAVVRLSAPTDDSAKCLVAMVTSRHFDHAYSGIALVALCQADDGNFAKHMELLRARLNKMFEESERGGAERGMSEEETEKANMRKRRLAEDVLAAIGLSRLADAIPDLNWSVGVPEQEAADDWLYDALFKHGDELLSYRTEGSSVFIYRTNSPETSVPLPSARKKRLRFRMRQAVFSMTKAKALGPKLKNEFKDSTSIEERMAEALYGETIVEPEFIDAVA